MQGLNQNELMTEFNPNSTNLKFEEP